MKKLFFVLITILFFTGCNMTRIDSKSDFVKVNPADELTFECGETSQTLTVSSSGKWTVGGVPEWIKVTPEQGKSEDDITVSVQENPDMEDRKGTFTITCGSAACTVCVTQYGAIETNYTDLDLEDKNTSLVYDDNSGKLTITYADGLDEGNDYKGKAIVLPAEYGFDIRVIDNSSSSGKTLTLETSQGNMSDLFKNTSFTLATSADPNTRSTAGERIITPAAIGYFDKDGKYHQTTSLATKDLYFENNDELWSCHTDFSGETIAEGSAGKLYWEKCKFDAELNAVFEFDFGEKQINEVDSKGDINRFSYTLDGSMDMDLLLHYLYEADYHEEEDEIIKENIIETIVYKFLVGEVPVYISVDTHLGKAVDFSAEGKVDATAGVMLEAEMQVGLEWTKERGAKVIKKAVADMDIHHPALEVEASATAKVSYYPHIDIKLYKFIGPWVEPRPYLKEKIEAGLRASTDGENYVGWSGKTYAGTDLKLGLDITFAFWDFTPWESEMLNPVEDNLLYEVPARITKISPEDGIELKAGETITAEFLVEAYSPITKKYYPCPNIYVYATADGGRLEKSDVKTDAEGIAQIIWTPSSSSIITRSKTSDITMTAAIMNAEGDVIDEATLSAQTDQERPTPGKWVDLGLPSGIKWAGWNVGASRPEEYGGYYAWGETSEKNTYNLDTYEHMEIVDYNSDGSPKWDLAYIGDCISGTMHDVARVRWGGGARMPTKEEQRELAYKCTWEYGYLNEVMGAFVTGPNGNSIFLPYAGYRHNNSHSGGLYLWSGTWFFDILDYDTVYFYINGAYYLSIYNYPGVDFSYDRAHGYSVRPVLD